MTRETSSRVGVRGLEFMRSTIAPAMMSLGGSTSAGMTLILLMASPPARKVRTTVGAGDLAEQIAHDADEVGNRSAVLAYRPIRSIREGAFGIVRRTDHQRGIPVHHGTDEQLQIGEGPGTDREHRFGFLHKALIQFIVRVVAEIFPGLATLP